ncbi:MULTISPECIES: hypothetical protein [unclassified Variovorax]|uniref:hypothetical protein n=1 Tax=unclassified Variovorax TaxID=663243 RepID=UPI00083981AE|nr:MULTISPECIES: hypothetical protein [unclassified Variovorax]
MSVPTIFSFTLWSFFYESKAKILGQRGTAWKLILELHEGQSPEEACAQLTLGFSFDAIFPGTSVVESMLVVTDAIRWSMRAVMFEAEIR